MTDSPQRAPQKLAKVGSIKEDDDAVRFNPLSATSSQRRLLRKAAGKDTHGKDAFLRHSSSGRDVTDDERSKSNAVDLIMFGLAQQHEKLHAVDYASQQEYRNKRMWVAVAMDSIYVNLLVITTVCVDVFSFLAFELRDSAEQDCFTRAAHVQEALNLFCLGLYTVEILIRGFANGWRHSYSFNKKNADQIFDTAIVAASVIMGVYTVWSDRNTMVPCPAGSASSSCPAPPREYTLVMDKKLGDPALFLCPGNLEEGTESSAVGSVQAGRTATTALRLLKMFSLSLRIVRALRMLLKANRIRGQIAKKIRARASKGMRRYQKMGFDLDLTYITTRLVCMAAPAVNQIYTRALSGELVGLNDAFLLSKFFATRHYGMFRAFNFCAEVLGNYATKNLFGQVRRIPTAEKTAPRLSDVLTFCMNAAHYLLLDESKILLLHCNTGRDRSGVFACAFLLYSGHVSTAEEALDLFSKRRLGTNRKTFEAQQAVRGASLARVVMYLETILASNHTVAPVELMLKSIRITSVPFADLRLVVICDGKTLLDSEDEDLKIEIKEQEASFPTLIIQGDTQIFVYNKRRGLGLPDFFVQFHTAFVSSRTTVTFEKTQTDFISQVQDSYPNDMKMVLTFTNDKTPRLKMLDAFRSAIRRNGRIQSYSKGNVVVKRGDLKPRIRLVLEGLLTEVVPTGSDNLTEESGLTMGHIEKTTVAIFGPGQIFGFNALCAGLPDNQVACMSASCEVAQIQLEKLFVNKHNRHFFSEEEEENDMWNFPGISEDELPGFLKALNHNLWDQCLSMQRTQRACSKETTFNDQMDLMMENVKMSAIERFDLPFYEECEHVHRCEVYDVDGKSIAERVIFLSNYVIFDTQMRGDTVKTSEKFVFHLEDISHACFAFPDITTISFTIRGEDYDARCGNQPGAKDFLTRLEGIMYAKHVLLRRLELESRCTPDKWQNFEPAMTPLLNLMPQSCLERKSVIVHAGDTKHGITFVSKGSVMLMDENRVVEVIKAGEFIGMPEYVLNIRTQFTAKVRGTEGCVVVQMPRPFLDAQLKTQPKLAVLLFVCGYPCVLAEIRPLCVDMFQFLARRASTHMYFLLLKQWPHACHVQDHSSLASKAHGDKPGKEEKAYAQSTYTRDANMVKLLKLRKSAFLKLIDDKGINLLASGMGSMRLAHGQTLMKQGDKVAETAIDSMYLVKSGMLEIYINGMEEENRIATMYKGEIVGERALLLQEDRSATVVAKGSVTLGVIRISQVEELVLRDPTIVKALKANYAGMTLQSLRTGAKNKRASSIKAQAKGVPLAQGLSIDGKAQGEEMTASKVEAQAAKNQDLSGHVPAAGPREGTNGFVPEPNLPYLYESQAFSGHMSADQEGSRAQFEPEPEMAPQQEWLGGVADQRILELAQIGTEMGIFPPFAYDNSNGSARYDDPNPRQRAGPATLHFLPGL